MRCRRQFSPMIGGPEPSFRGSAKIDGAARGSPTMQHSFRERSRIRFNMRLRRRSDLSREAFFDDWLNRHGPLVLSLAGALRIRQYHQGHTLDHGRNEVVRKTRGTIEPVDGIAETWFDRVEDLEGSFATPEGREAGVCLREDEARFLDLSQCAGWIAREHHLLSRDWVPLRCPAPTPPGSDPTR